MWSVQEGCKYVIKVPVVLTHMHNFMHNAPWKRNCGTESNSPPLWCCGKMPHPSGVVGKCPTPGTLQSIKFPPPWARERVKCLGYAPGMCKFWIDRYINLIQLNYWSSVEGVWVLASMIWFADTISSLTSVCQHLLISSPMSFRRFGNA